MTLRDQASHSDERAHLGYGSDGAVKPCDCDDTHRLQRQTQSAEVVRLLRQNAVAVTSIPNRNTAKQRNATITGCGINFLFITRIGKAE